MKSGLTDLTHLFGKLQVRREGGGEGWGRGSVLAKGKPEAVGHCGWKTDCLRLGGV